VLVGVTVGVEVAVAVAVGVAGAVAVAVAVAVGVGVKVAVGVGVNVAVGVGDMAWQSRNKIETLFEPWLAVARSCLPSPLKSPTTTE
jgi:hypothetical protein